MIKLTRVNDILISTCDIRNKTDTVQTILQPKMLDIDLKVNEIPRVHYFHSDWGDEFSPRLEEVNSIFKINSRLGRSAKHANPTFYIEVNGKFSLFHIAWSGNYDVCFEKKENNLNICVSLEEGFQSELNPGTEFTGFDVICSLHNDTLDQAVNKLYKYVRNAIYKEIDFVPPLVWNHWWTYEDITITEEIFMKNVDVASKMGFEYAMLDAGWFGEKSEFWELIRGDWHQYNKERFPSGIKALAEYVKSKNMKFGIWIELEGLGINSKINVEKPWLVAKDGNQSLEYICLGDERNQQWAYQQLLMLIEDFGADYIKIDFNLDPNRGCNCTAHNHGEKDGLYKHYIGLYKVLANIKDKYPNVVLENCSSGGLRADLKLLENFDICFMSDPDYTEHSHQCFQGFRLFLPPERIFHFSWSHAIDKGRYAIPQCDYNNRNLTDAFKKYTIRSVSQHGFGLSHPLIDLSTTDRQLVMHEMKLHRSLIRIINKANLFVSKTQTIKNFQGERNPFYLYQTDTDFVLFNYGLEMAEYCQTIQLDQYGIDISEYRVVCEIDADYKIENNLMIVHNNQQTASILHFKKI